MEDSSPLRVFLSYARLDGSGLAEELSAGLELLRFMPVMDKRDIAAAEDWEQRLDALIRQSDTVTFLLSPTSVQSSRCAWEVARAVALSKRIIPVVVAPVAENEVPEALRKLNFIDFGPGQSFARSLGLLADALRTDLGWIREHTRLAELAARWIERNRDEALLLRGAELDAAQAWMSKWHTDAPALTDAQRALITASTDATVLRDSVERQRLDEMTQANASRAEALVLREHAVTSLRRRTMLGAAAAGALSLGLSLVGLLYMRAARERDEERKRADDAAARSLLDAAKREALRTDLEGQVVVYAASPGQFASDDSGFTKGLLDQLGSEQVPLSIALSRTVRKVIEKTAGAQRPYIATDMNGDVYFRIAAPSRQRRALVVTIDHFGDQDIPGVRADGKAWSTFFHECRFEVQSLQNPQRDEVIAALYNAGTARVSMPSSMVMLTGLLPGPPGAVSGASRGEPEKTKTTAVPNSFFAFYFAGYGFRIDDVEYLAMSDYPANKRGNEITDETVGATTVKVSDVTKMLRERFAASCLIFDTQFLRRRRNEAIHDVDAPR